MHYKTKSCGVLIYIIFEHRCWTFPTGIHSGSLIWKSNCSPWRWTSWRITRTTWEFWPPSRMWGKRTKPTFSSSRRRWEWRSKTPSSTTLSPLFLLWLVLPLLDLSFSEELSVLQVSAPPIDSMVTFQPRILIVDFIKINFFTFSSLQFVWNLIL